MREAVHKVHDPKLEDIFDRVYARPTADLVAQRAQIVSEAAAR